MRTVHKTVTGKELADVEFTPVRGAERIREAEVDLGEAQVKVAVVHTLKAAEKVLQALDSGRCDYQFVEVMACPNGCAGGGGQPRDKHAYQAATPLRQAGLYHIDRETPVRQSHNNPMIIKLYKEFLGTPLGPRSHELLHTGYRNRKHRVMHTMKEIWEEIEAWA